MNTTIIMCHTLYIYRRKLQNLDVPKCWSHETSHFFLPKTFMHTVVRVQLCFSAVEPKIDLLGSISNSNF
jgi:hypothetical protein